MFTEKEAQLAHARVQALAQMAAQNPFHGGYANAQVSVIHTVMV